jgi:hypothetical protein
METAASAQRLRRRFEAWSAQILQLLGILPGDRRRSTAVRRLIEQHRRLRDRIAAWSGGESERRELEREWSRLKRAWSRTLTVVDVAT